MVLILWPAMNAAGAPIGKKEAVVMIWSGLRGAVALAMAIIVDEEKEVPTETGSRIMFHIGGLAAMTTLINATTTAPLLAYLDLTKTNEMKERCLSSVAHDIHLDVSRKFEEKMAGHEDLRCLGANEDLVRAMVPALKARAGPALSEEGAASFHPLSANMPQAEREEYRNSLTQIYRDTFLQVVRTHYWEAIEECMVPKCGLTARYLLESVDEAIEQTWDL
jgi:NhaP-type Na+/H+ and K+/H+ antiporter